MVGDKWRKGSLVKIKTQFNWELFLYCPFSFVLRSARSIWQVVACRCPRHSNMFYKTSCGKPGGKDCNEKVLSDVAWKREADDEVRQGKKRKLGIGS